MPSITTRFTDPIARLVARIGLYAAILIGAWVVANVTGGAPPVFIYQGF
jgi:hypothetical protein